MTSKKSNTLEELYQERSNAKEELKILKQKDKILTNQISTLTRKERTHRLCSRGGMLEAFLPCPESISNDEIMELLKLAFNQQCVLDKLEDLRNKYQVFSE